VARCEKKIFFQKGRRYYSRKPTERKSLVVEIVRLEEFGPNLFYKNFGPEERGKSKGKKVSRSKGGGGGHD